MTGENIYRSETGRGRVFLRVGFLLLFWSITLPLLYRLTDSTSIVVESSRCNDISFAPISSTEFGAFAMAYYNPEQKYRPQYGVSFEKLNVSNRSMGFLRTALHQNLELEQLRLILFSYSQDHLKEPKDAQETKNDNLLCFPNPLHTISTPLLSQFRNPSQTNRKIRFPDISKTTQISITDFSVNWKIDNQSELTIQSRRAVFAVERSDEVLLSGRVILETPSGKIQTNRIVWNMEKELFHIKGQYHYSTQEITFSGRDDSLDYRLNILTNSNLTESLKGGPLWSANE